MLLGLTLFYVGAVLILNGLWMLGRIGDREIARRHPTALFAAAAAPPRDGIAPVHVGAPAGAIAALPRRSQPVVEREQRVREVNRAQRPVG